jgi:hypothetical protein
MGKKPTEISRTNRHKESCRLEADYRRVASLAHDTAQAMHHLRHKLYVCQACGLNRSDAEQTHCLRLETFNLVVREAIQEVLDAWEAPL